MSVRIGEEAGDRLWRVFKEIGREETRKGMRGFRVGNALGTGKC